MAYKQFSFGIVREDTAINIVFVLSDSSEIVLMDYNLSAGDTFTTPYYKYPVLSVDSTMINSVWHKVWKFSPVRSGIIGGTDLSVIEGVGCIQHPTYMIQNFDGCVECSQPFMYCFSNNGLKPPLIPKVDFLDNTTSCPYFATVSAEKFQVASNQLTISPNPATTSVLISMSTNSGQITIYNVLGQMVFNQPYYTQKLMVEVGSWPSGIYLVAVDGAVVKRLAKI